MTKQGAVLLFLAAALMVIGIHQTVVLSFAEAYWIIMLAIALFLIARYLDYRKTSGGNSPAGKKDTRNSRAK